MPNTEYDLVPYQSNPYPQAHPDHLAVMGQLFGMHPATAERCRVLELGCSSGGNLIPMAASYPDSTFVGIDLAGSAIELGKETIAELGLRNIELRHGSVLEIDASWGEFDYIVCHGLYSWVPEPVREGILRVMRASLAPQGIGFVSYNAMPGWGLRGLVRDMMMFHVQGIEDPEMKIAQARALLDFLVRSTPEHTEYGHVLRAEQKFQATLKDWYLFHDNLAPEMRAFWFHEFATRVEEVGLQYLGDATLATMVLTNFDPAVVATLDKLAGDLYRTEQYLDFVRNRQFRQSLVAHGDVDLVRALDWRAIQQFTFTTRARPAGEVDVRGRGPGEFITAQNTELTTSEPLAKAMLMELFERRPIPVSFDDLVEAARRRVYDDPPQDAESIEADRETVGKNVFSLVASDVAHVRLSRPAIASELSERPEAWPYARSQARRGAPQLTNLRHEGVDVDELDRRVVMRLDGTLTFPEIIEALLEDVAAGDLIVRKQEGEFESEEELRAAMEKVVGATLATLLQTGLLIA